MKRHVPNRPVISRQRRKTAPGMAPVMTPPNAAPEPRRGLSEELVREISRVKGEPGWMLEKRLLGLKLFSETPLPSWGPDLAPLDLDGIVYFTPPGAPEAASWEEVPADIRATFEKLGIPEAERRVLAGAGAQYDSDVVYHRLKDDLTEQGVIFANMDTAVRDHEEIVRRHFMADCVPVSDHKFAMLHAAVWSGGTFIYVPPGLRVTLPLQAYFRMNAERGGQFEHTLIIVDEGASVEYIEGCSAPRYATSSLHAGCVELYVRRSATLRYVSIENWSRNTWNLNTKRALVDEGGRVEWLGGNVGAGLTMLYPTSVLRGRGASAEHVGAALAASGQRQDIGAKVILAAPDTKAVIRSKSVSKDGGISVFRGLVRATPAARRARATMQCDALLLDGDSVSRTFPTLRSETPDAEIAHEATVGRLGEDELFYLRSRGLDETEAKRLMVAGFVEPVSRRLPLEYAVEFNRLIAIEMTGSVG